MLCFLLFSSTFGTSAGFSEPEGEFETVFPQGPEPILQRARADYELVREHVKNLSSFGSRFTTYPGYEQAVTYIENWFRKYLTNVEIHTYNLTVIADYGATMTVHPTGQNFTLYPLVPNVVSPVITPSEGLTGPLVYVGKGEIADFNNKTIKDSIVLMDFNSHLHWLDAAKFGAKAVIFVEPSFTLREEAFRKRLDIVPLNFPRFYIKKEDFWNLRNLLVNGEYNVTVRGETRWENRPAVNIMGYAPGWKHPDEWIIIAAYFDSYSVVPSIAPGASEACSIATLLALAKYYHENPPETSVLFVAFSGHNQGVWGAREWVEKYIFGSLRYLPASPYYREETLAANTLGAFGLDIWPDTSLLYPYAEAGFPYDDGSRSKWGDEMPSLIYLRLQELYYWLKDKTGKDYGLTPQDFLASKSPGSSIEVVTPVFKRMKCLDPLWPFAPVSFFSTGKAWLPYYGTPIDTFDRLEPLLPNLKPQLELLYVWLHYILNSDTLRDSLINQPANKWLLSQAHERMKRIVPVFGRVYTWNLTDWTPMPQYDPEQTVLVKLTGGRGGDYYK
ncbi:hypothetical protein DRO55_03135, partial [Candidatus Bathyarchaeota archaeon]